MQTITNSFQHKKTREYLNAYLKNISNQTKNITQITFTKERVTENCIMLELSISADKPRS